MKLLFIKHQIGVFNTKKILPGQKMLSMKVTDDRVWYANDESYFCEFSASSWTVTVKEQYDGYSKIAFSSHERYIQFCLLEGESRKTGENE